MHNLLHNHPRMEAELNLDKNHVIVDRKDWELVLQFLYDSGEIDRIVKRKIQN